MSSKRTTRQQLLEAVRIAAEHYARTQTQAAVQALRDAAARAIQGGASVASVEEATSEGVEREERAAPSGSRKVASKRDSASEKQTIDTFSKFTKGSRLHGSFWRDKDGRPLGACDGAAMLVLRPSLAEAIRAFEGLRDSIDSAFLRAKQKRPNGPWTEGVDYPKAMEGEGSISARAAIAVLSGVLEDLRYAAKNKEQEVSLQTKPVDVDGLECIFAGSTALDPKLIRKSLRALGVKSGTIRYSEDTLAPVLLTADGAEGIVVVTPMRARRS